MKTIDKNLIAKLVEEAIPHLAFELPEDVSDGLRSLYEKENHKTGKNVLDMLCTNDCIARKDQVPICQDTGTVRIWLQIGKNICLAGDVFEGVNDAIANAYKKHNLRMSVVKDAINDRSNTCDNTPAFCEIETVDRQDFARLNIMIKGGGSDNASRVCMLTPGDGKQGIIDSVVNCVKEKGASACPPLVIGIGLGGTFDSVGSLAHKALFRKIGENSSDTSTSKLEKEILNAVNSACVGPAGLGGITAHQVNIITAPTHIASLPLAIDMGCCALRRLSIDLLDGDRLDSEMDGDWLDSGNNQSQTCPRPLKKKLSLPLRKEDIKKLKIGDKVLLSGPVFTLRDAGHLRFLKELENDNKLPYGLEGQTIFYAGPTPAKAGRPFGAIGPTTSSRMDFAAPTLFKKGVVATIGKGERSQAVKDACKKFGTVHFSTVGGCAAYLAKCIESEEIIAYEDLGTEALRKCIVKDLPVFVSIA